MRTSLVVMLFAAVALAVPGALPGARAQDPPMGTIVGVVLDASTGEPIIDAGVEVVGLEKSARTNLDGKYEITVPPGTYELRVFAPLYRGARLQRVVVAAGRTAAGDAALAPSGDQAGVEVVEVIAEASKAAERTQLLKRQRAAVVSDNISAEVIKKSADSDASEIIERVPAVTVKDDKFVVVRGLGERYSSALLNGSRLPSTDPEKRVVPLDLFPASFLESISIVKTYTPDLPGDFSGGLADIELSEPPEEFTFSFGVSTSGNTQSTFQKFDTYEGGGFDYFGFDQNVRSLPSLIGDRSIIGAPGAQAQAFGRSFKNIWDLDSRTAPPNFGVSFSIGDTIGPLGLELAGTYGTEYKTRRDQIERQFLQSGTPENPIIVLGNDFAFDVGTFETRLGGVFIASYDLSPDHRLTFRSLLDRNVTDEVKDGFGLSEQIGDIQRSSAIEYTQEELAFGQFAGAHHFPWVDLDWRTAFSRTTQERPDTRLSTRVDGLFTNESNGGVRAFSDLTEYLTDSAVDLTVPFTTRLPFTDVWRGLPAKFKFGPAYAFRDRDSELRRFRFRRATGANLDLSLPTEALLAPENIGPNGFFLLEETLPQDAFAATEEVIGGYGMFDLPLIAERLRFVGGVRTEYSLIRVDTFSQSTQSDATISKKSVDPLPGLNLIYSPRDDMNVRVGYSQSVSRPEFRELSPAVFPAARGFRPIIGDPTLVQSEIESIDLRWEWFFSPTELISLSGFYKSIDRPIEQVVLVQGGQPTDSFANADTATLKGFEFEARKHFGFVGPGWENLAFQTNVAYVDSEVDVPPPTPGSVQVQTESQRALQGQAPYVVNASLEYTHPRWGTARLLYNTAGPQISSVGAFGLPDIFEERRDQIDLVFLTEVAPFGTPLNLKVAIENIPNDNFLFTQDDQVQREYTTGMTFSLGVSYTY